MVIPKSPEGDWKIHFSRLDKSILNYRQLQLTGVNFPDALGFNPIEVKGWMALIDSCMWPKTLMLLCFEPFAEANGNEPAVCASWGSHSPEGA